VDGFRALTARTAASPFASRRDWNMTTFVPELAELPARRIFDGEIVSFDACGRQRELDGLVGKRLTTPYRPAIGDG
jgi:ATP-dependent DNA ligase